MRDGLLDGRRGGVWSVTYFYALGDVDGSVESGH